MYAQFKKQTGFTHAELSIGILVLALVVLIAVNSYQGYQRKVLQTEALVVLHNFSKLVAASPEGFGELTDGVLVSNKGCELAESFGLSIPNCNKFPYNIQISTCGNTVKAIATNNAAFGCGDKVVDVWEMIAYGSDVNITQLSNAADAAGCQAASVNYPRTIGSICKWQFQNANSRSQESTVVICHKPGENQKTIEIDQSDLGEHISHGDTMGACR